MIMQDFISELMADYNSKEIENRLNNIFNGYLGCDTGDMPEELQQNHHLITSIIEVFRQWDKDKNATCTE